MDHRAFHQGAPIKSNLFYVEAQVMHELSMTLDQWQLLPVDVREFHVAFYIARNSATAIKHYADRPKTDKR